MIRTKYVKLVLVSGIMAYIPLKANNSIMDKIAMEKPGDAVSENDNVTSVPYSHHREPACKDSTHSTSHGGFGYYGGHGCA